jgi:hypothetical protein
LYESSQDIKWEIHPYVGVGPIKFGMNKKQVQHIIGKSGKEYVKNKILFQPEDFTVSFDSSGKCEYIEFYERSNLVFKNILFFKKPIKIIINQLKGIDKNIKIETKNVGSYANITSNSLGVSFGSSRKLDNPAAEIISVYVFKKGYHIEPEKKQDPESRLVHDSDHLIEKEFLSSFYIRKFPSLKQIYFDCKKKSIIPIQKEIIDDIKRVSKNPEDYDILEGEPITKISEVMLHTRIDITDKMKLIFEFGVFDDEVNIGEGDHFIHTRFEIVLSSRNISIINHGVGWAG